jgi:hypothetical protein
MEEAAVTQVIERAVTRHGDGQFAVVFLHGFLDDRHTTEGGP